MAERTQRPVILFTFLIVIFLFYTIYLFYLQVVQGYIYALRAEQVAVRTKVVTAQRGFIYDRNYDLPLAENLNAFEVSLTPGEISTGEHLIVFQRLADVLGVKREFIEAKIPETVYNSYQSIIIQDELERDVIFYLAENLHLFPGISWQTHTIRNYPFGAQFSHILGYVGGIGQAELDVLINRGYTASSILGKSGIELQYDTELRGKDGLHIRKVDAQGKRLQADILREIPPEPGMNIVLTIDRHIQELASKALGERNGSVIIMKPTSGEILAMVSYPTFNPNIFSANLNSREFTELSLDPRSPFLNRAIQSLAAPASTFKIVMATTLASENSIPLDHTIFDSGSKVFGDRRFHCWHPSGHGAVDFFDALADSCNIYFYTVGAEYLGIDSIIEYADRFGLGHFTGIDLPGEKDGHVPNPEWKEEFIRDVWRLGDTVNLSIGQGYIQVTPLQMANVMAMIINDGILYTPHLHYATRDPVSGAVLKKKGRSIMRQLEAKNDAFANVRKALRRVVTHGTSKIVLTTPSTDIAGKTGTGQVSQRDDRYDSWFAAYAPYTTDKPEERIIVLVMVDSSNEWEWWAPKAANIIFHALFTDQNYEESIADLKKKKLLWYM